MPGGRPIAGRDVHAAFRHAGAPRGAEEAVRREIPPDRLFESYADLRAAVPPERLGLSSGAHAALFGPLFGEFE
jgi:hypothetical protein